MKERRKKKEKQAKINKRKARGVEVEERMFSPAFSTDSTKNDYKN
jgi:hypothetical protein